MFRNVLFLMMIAGIFASPVILRGQEPQPPVDEVKDTSGPERFWQATLGKGHYMVALDRISSVSRHQFLLDGGLIVDEVTVDTAGQALARFYFISPVTDAAPGDTLSQLTERASELLDRGAAITGSNVQDMVVKTYPGTTHAKSVEYRLRTVADLTALYDSVRTSWESGRGRKFALK